MLPAGFIVNGRTVGKIPPQVEKIAAFLDRLPALELVTSNEMAARLRYSRCGEVFSHLALSEYRERVGNKLYWGNKQTILDLRSKLQSEDSDD